MALLLDTHVVHWMAMDLPRLGRRARKAIETEVVLHVSVVSMWEFDTLVRRGRLKPPIDITLRDFARSLQETGHRFVPLDLDVVQTSGELPDMHNDPADRFLLATAKVHNLTLVTADWKLLDWRGSVKRLNAEQ